MFVSLSMGAMLKHVFFAGVGGFVAGVGSVLLYQKIKGCNFTTATIMVEKNKSADSLTNREKSANISAETVVGMTAHS